jgi:hypothetical protein
MVCDGAAPDQRPLGRRRSIVAGKKAKILDEVEKAGDAGSERPLLLLTKAAG